MSLVLGTHNNANERKDDAALMAWLSRKRGWEPSPGELAWGAWDWAFAGIAAGMVAGACWMAWNIVV